MREWNDGIGRDKKTDWTGKVGRGRKWMSRIGGAT